VELRSAPVPLCADRRVVPGAAKTQIENRSSKRCNATLVFSVQKSTPADVLHVACTQAFDKSVRSKVVKCPNG
jgi:hypothetical protein